MKQENDMADNIALCLSGGGLRATLFHLGLIRALRDHGFGDGPALQRIREIYSVSGGSILAAHLIQHWQSYCGDEAAFAEQEKKIRDFARRNVRDRVLRRWVASLSIASRTPLLQAEYRSLLGRGTLAECYPDAGPRPPRLHILATSFKTGELCSFSCDRFEIVRRKDKKWTTVTEDGSRLPLTYAVAASSAFPPMFPPLALTHTMLGVAPKDEFPLYLSDGGVYDNLGFEKFLADQSSGASKATMLIGSNAGGSFKTEAKTRFAGPFSRNMRANDIMMRRVLEGTEDAIQRLPDVRYVPVKIGDTSEDANLSPDIQRELRSVRTDLDHFGPDLADLLIDHGYRIGAAALLAQGATPLATAKDIDTHARREPEKVVRQAARRSFWSIAFDIRDWKILPILWIYAGALFSGTYVLVQGYLDEQKNLEQSRVTLDAVQTHIRRMKDTYDNEGDAALRDATLGKQFADLQHALEVVAKDPRISFQEATETNAPTSGQVKLDVVEPMAKAEFVPLPVKPAPPQTSYKQKVYIQFAGTFTREQITDFNGSLQAAGWNAQGKSGERLSSAAGLNEIRYKRGNAEAEAAARALRTAIVATGVVPVLDVKPLPIIQRDVLEIWISN